jgi:hypothetical protein
MDKVLVAILGLLFAAAAAAQQYKWVDADGKVRYGDTPPPGVKATPLRPPPPGAAPAPSAATKKPDAKGGEDPQKAREKQEQAEKEAKAKQENCGHAREALRSLESGERIARTDSKGERFYLEDEQIRQERAKAQQTVQQWCN